MVGRILRLLHSLFGHAGLGRSSCEPRHGCFHTLHVCRARVHRNRARDHLLEQTWARMVNHAPARHICVQTHQINWTLWSTAPRSRPRALVCSVSIETRFVRNEGSGSDSVSQLNITILQREHVSHKRRRGILSEQDNPG